MLRMAKCKELVSICLICMLANNIDSRENKLFSVRCCVSISCYIIQITDIPKMINLNDKLLKVHDINHVYDFFFSLTLTE